MSLKGNIETVTLSGVFQLLCNESKSGILDIKRGDTEYQIYFLDGNILYAIQSMKLARLGDLLVEDNIITAKDLQKCLVDAQKEKIALGKILVDKGYLSSEMLEKYISKQILEILCEIFEWETGEFTYNDINYSLKWLVMIKLRTLQLVMEAMRLIDEKKTNQSCEAA